MSRKLDLPDAFGPIKNILLRNRASASVKFFQFRVRIRETIIAFGFPAAPEYQRPRDKKGSAPTRTGIILSGAHAQVLSQVLASYLVPGRTAAVPKLRDSAAKSASMRPRDQLGQAPESAPVRPGHWLKFRPAHSRLNGLRMGTAEQLECHAKLVRPEHRLISKEKPGPQSSNAAGRAEHPLDGERDAPRTSAN